MKNVSWSTKLILTFGSIIIASVVAIVVILSVFKPAKDSIEFEIVKSLLQILTVLVLGQVVSLVIAQFNYNRQKTEARTEFQKDVLRRLIRNYTAIKKHRRLLRAKAVTPPYDGKFQENTLVQFDAYDEQMQLINEVELEFENIWQEIESSPDLFSNSKSLAEYIERMKDYLRDLLHLYEQKRGTFSGDPRALLLSDLKCVISEIETPSTFAFSDLVGDTKGSIFKKDFIKPYREASKAIREDILK
ncbi:MAG: hypothetical protein DMF63_09820 [Acidobacteria bacterium]|nr:MAG: hypothetical protein DMF63_09820 [Acidobacteriota bacterium]